MEPSATTVDSVADLGQQIRARRRELGLTQTELAAASNTSLRFISEVERGRGTAGFDRVLRLAASVGLSVRVIER